MRMLGSVTGKVLGKTVAGDDEPLWGDRSGKIDMGFPAEHNSTLIGSIGSERLGRLHTDASPPHTGARSSRQPGRASSSAAASAPCSTSADVLTSRQRGRLPVSCAAGSLLPRSHEGDALKAGRIVPPSGGRLRPKDRRTRAQGNGAARRRASRQLVPAPGGEAIPGCREGYPPRQ